MVTSDRGLAGPYNANVLRTAAELMARQADGVEPRLYVAGRKGIGYYRFRRRELADSWSGVADRPDYDDAKQVADTCSAFLDHEVDELHMVYTDFVSAATQRAEARRIIPLVVETTERPPSRSRCTSTSPAPGRARRPAAPVRRGQGVHGHAGGGLRARGQAPGDEAATDNASS